MAKLWKGEILRLKQDVTYSWFSLKKGLVLDEYEVRQVKNYIMTLFPALDKADLDQMFLDDFVDVIPNGYFQAHIEFTDYGKSASGCNFYAKNLQNGEIYLFSVMEFWNCIDDICDKKIDGWFTRVKKGSIVSCRYVNDPLELQRIDSSNIMEL